MLTRLTFQSKLMNYLDDIFQYIGLILIIINAILYTKSYILKKKDVALLLLSLYLCTSAFIMIMVEIIANKGGNNLYLSHIYFISQFILLSLFYKTLFNSKQSKIVTGTLLIVLVFLTVQYIKKPYLIDQFNLFEIFITSLPIIVYSIIHLYNSLSKKGKFMFLNSGVLIYITTSTLIFILGNYLSGSYNNNITSIWLINKILYIVYLILILVEWKTIHLLPKKK